MFDHGVIVAGAGHNGLVCAAYLARAGLDVLVVEARDAVGGCASTVDALDGARVNICNCDHTMVRASGVIEELGLHQHGLRYVEPEADQLAFCRDDPRPWLHFADVERTIESLRVAHPEEVDGYRRYLAAAVPAARTVLAMSRQAPTPGAALGQVRGAPRDTARALDALLRWSRRSVADVASSFFCSESLRAPLIAAGPAVWGLAPSTPGTGLGALGYAMRHVQRVGRPVGGSGALTDALRSAVEHAGGRVRTGAAVTSLLCDEGAVAGVRLVGGEVLRAPIVVAAVDPRRALVEWLGDVPSPAAALVAAYRDRPQHDGYESKVDALLSRRFRYRAVGDALLDAVGCSHDDVLAATAVIAPSIAAMDDAHALAQRGRIADAPIFFAQVPSVPDPSLAAGAGRATDVFSLEVLWTPYELAGGWDGSGEAQRWLRLFGRLVDTGRTPDASPPGGVAFEDTVLRHRLMGPREYEAQFGMARGHAPSFAGSPLSALRGRSPEQTRYATPVRGLYLTGAGTFPGAGIWGASGRNAATAVLTGDARSARARRAVRDALAPPA